MLCEREFITLNAMASIFITGSSHGLGLGLTRYYVQQGCRVYGLARGECPIEHPGLKHSRLDLSDVEAIPAALQKLLPEQLDLAILNAGLLGKIQDMSETSMSDVRQIMDVNVWSNKIITDWLIRRLVGVDQLIYLSSGASVNGNRGWGIYAISKASINMMARLYAHEMPNTHITALAPGLVRTRMMNYLCHETDRTRFPSMQNLIDAERANIIPDTDHAAQNVARSLQRCLDHPSGSFIDIRKL